MTRSKLRRSRIKANRIARHEAQRWPKLTIVDGEDGESHIVRVPRSQWFAGSRYVTLLRSRGGVSAFW